MIFDETKPEAMVRLLRSAAGDGVGRTQRDGVLDEAADMIEDLLEVIQDLDSTIAHLAEQNRKFASSSSLSSNNRGTE